MEEFQEQHAIPQQISAYQFRLVGDMTLRQFFQLAAGALVSLLVYATTLPTLIKWPLIIFSFLAGVAFAFFPLEDRPLEKWIYLFVRSIYSPTLYIWNKGAVLPSYFKPEDAVAAPVELPKTTEEEVMQQVQSAPVGNKEETKKALTGLEKGEEEFLSKVSTRFGDKSTSVKLKPEPDYKIIQPTTANVRIPSKRLIRTEIKDHAQEAVAHVAPTAAPIESTITPRQTRQTKATSQVQFSQEASPPLTPDSPNIIVGQVLGPSGELVEGAILEFQDDLGRPTRAVRTNKLGHFMIVTSLIDGEYKIITEKDGYEFDHVSFTASGEIIPPIVIIAKKKTESNQINNGINQIN